MALLLMSLRFLGVSLVPRRPLSIPALHCTANAPDKRPTLNHRYTMTHLFGFPPGYFVIRSVATGRLWDVSLDEVEDGTPVILWSEKEQSLVEGEESGPGLVH